MTSGSDVYRQQLEAELERGSRQIAVFRFLAASTVLALQVFFLIFAEGWTGAPMGPLLGYVVAASVAWRLRRRFDRWAEWTGYTIAVLDMPFAFWLVRASWIDNLHSDDAAVAGGVLMMLPLSYAGFIVMASLALDAKQTLAAAGSAIVFQAIALTEAGHDFTFVSMVSMFTAFVAVLCVYWRDQSVRLVRSTSDEQVRRERLGRYFSPQIASLVETGTLGSVAERREVTVLFADLRDFTRLAEALDSREVVVLLNRFHSAMVDVVFANGGTLDKYLGDGLMAYFGAPVEQPDHALRAVRCALGMQAALAELNRGVSGRELRMGIGVNTGLAVVGDIGATSRREFTVIGDAVNVAARLEKLTKELDVDVLVAGATAEAAGAAMDFRFVDRVALRGRSEPVEVYVPEVAASLAASA